MMTYNEFLNQLQLVKSEMSKLLYDMYVECSKENNRKAMHQ